MAAPSSTTWGSIYGDYGKLGIYTSVTKSGSSASVNVQVWFSTKYSVTDSNNTFYYDVGTNITEATTSYGGVDISHTVSSGDGWSTSNQTKLIDKTYTYTLSKSSTTYKVYASLKNIDKVGTQMYCNSTYTVPKLDSYTVSFDANGGSGAPSSQTKWYGESLTLSTTKPTRTGYSFLGWSTSKTATSASYSSGGNYTSNSGNTLYAVWSEYKLTINYYSNGATSAFSGALNEVGKGKNVKVYTSDYYYDNDYSTYGLGNYSGSSGSLYMTRTGYNATKYWGTSASGGTLVHEDTGYSTGQALAVALKKDISKGNASINVYAQWTPYTHTVSYDANGGSGAPASQTKKYDSVIQIQPDIPTRTGYKFVEWNTESDGTGTPYDPNETYGYDKNGGTVVLYAVWSPNVLTIKYNVNGGTTNSDKYYISNNLINITSSSSTLEDKWEYNNGHENGLYNASTFGLKREGYKFIGWKVGSSGSVVFDQDDASIVPTDLASNLTTGDRTVTLYAVWEISGVVYIDNGTKLEPYLVYIDNGSTWDLYFAYVDDGSDWTIIS